MYCSRRQDQQQGRNIYEFGWLEQFSNKMLVVDGRILDFVTFGVFVEFI